MLALLTQTPTPPIIWPTPTLIGADSPPVTPVLPVLGEMIYEPPEWIVAGYQIVNRHHIFDFFWYMVIVLVLFAAIWVIIRRYRSI
jgi:hypothetical protein